MRILVLAGGDSDERDVSLRSGAAVSNALTAAHHVNRMFDPAAMPLTAKLTEEFDVAFPVIHGRGGEDGELQRQLENFGLAYVGSEVASSRLCFDKWAYREAMLQAGLAMAGAAIVSADNYQANPLAAKPYVLKPVSGGSSIDTFIVRDLANAPHDQIRDAFVRHEQMLLEELIEGIELTVGVLGGQPLPVIEIVPPEGAEFDYENKYNGATQELCPPEHVSSELQAQAQELALKAHQLAGCRDFSRTDIMIDRSNELVILETNTIPGMTDQSLFPRMAATAGIPMPELCDRLAAMAAKRRTATA
jgi:D-alanine-D-alanine ligase